MEPTEPILSKTEPILSRTGKTNSLGSPVSQPGSLANSLRPLAPVQWCELCARNVYDTRLVRIELGGLGRTQGAHSAHRAPAHRALTVTLCDACVRSLVEMGLAVRTPLSRYYDATVRNGETYLAICQVVKHLGGA